MSRQIGIVGLGMVGTMISRRLAQRGFSLSLYNRYVPGEEERVAWQLTTQYQELHTALPFEDLGSFVQSLVSPRTIFVMINAGSPTEEVLQALLPLLDSGDLIIDGGNAHFEDTVRRYREFKAKGIQFLGCGISGGIEGNAL